jgi:hypothetical protein
MMMQKVSPKPLFFECWCCSKNTPTALKNTHHIVPQAAGGTDTIHICSTCHTIVHSIAVRLLNSGKQAELEAIIMSIPEEQTRQRSVKLAKFVAEEMTLKADRGVQDKDIIKFTVHLNKDDHLLLKTAATDMRIGMEDLVLQILRKELKRIV